MAIKRKTVLGRTNNSPAQKLFTDREEPQESFIKALTDVNTRDYSILTYYGVGGIGKSSLQKHLKEEHLDKNTDSIYSWVDFDIEANRTPHKAFRVLAQNFKKKFKITFTAFDLAYTIYWTKAFPEYDLKKDGLPFIEAGSVVSSLIDTMESAHGGAGAFISVIDYGYKKYKEMAFDDELKSAVDELKFLDAGEIEKKLGIFFAYDIDKFKEKNPDTKVVIFLDTYEVLWQHKRTQANALSQDLWIRDMIVSELSNVLIVICGREKIRWQELDPEWEEYLDQHILGNLSEKDARSFLISCNIKDVEIQNKIIESSEGLPYYLDLCVDTFYQIKNSGKIPFHKDFTNVGKDKIFERFMRYLSHSEQETLKVLANARFYTKEIFSALIDEFKTGYPVTAMTELNNFSFISEDDGAFFIHDLMRTSLLSSQEIELQKNVYEFLFNYYNKELQDLDIKHITQKSIEALPEAFYHKESMGDIEALSDWYNAVYNKFFDAAKYKVILHTTLVLNALCSKVLGETHPSTAVSYNNLAVLYSARGEYDNALPLYKKFLAINEKILGKEHPDTATSYSNLGELYRALGEYKDALTLLKKSLAINEKVLGEEHPNTATSYNNLAGLYEEIRDYDNALPLFIRSLTIRKKVLGEEHLDTAASYHNLGEFYREIGEYKDALPLLKKALSINEEVLGEEHPNTATSYNSLAVVYDSIGEYKDALPLYKKSIVIIEKVLGEKHPNTVASYYNLAGLYNSMGEYKNALPLLKKSLSINEQRLGEEHPDTLESHYNLAGLYSSMGEHKNALPLLKKSLSINEERLGKEHPDTAKSYNNLGVLYYQIREYENALPLFIRSLTIRKKVLGEDHPDTVESYNNLEILYKFMG